MIIEGKGELVPIPIKIHIGKHQYLECLHLAEHRENYRRYGSHASQWKQGLIASSVLYGLMGEYAFSCWLSTFGIDIKLNTEDFD